MSTGHARDVDLANNCLRVRGSGQKAQRIPITPSFAGTLEKWLSLRAFNWDGPLVTRIWPDGTIGSNSMTVGGLVSLARDWAKRVNVSRLSIGDLRRIAARTTVPAGLEHDLEESDVMALARLSRDAYDLYISGGTNIKRQKRALAVLKNRSPDDCLSSSCIFCRHPFLSGTLRPVAPA